MGDVRMNGPDPVKAHGACVLCLARAKYAQYDRHREAIEKHRAAEGDELIYIPWDADLDKQLRPGPYRAVPGDAPHLGIVEGLCWDDVAGAQAPAQASNLLRGGPVPPGLMKGRG